MRFSFLTVLALAVREVQSSTVFINEFHYDNAGSDTGEFIEIAGPSGTDISTYEIVLYNGNNGNSYNTIPMSGTLDCLSDGFGFRSFSLPANGIQNGAPDGLCLTFGGSVVEFLSYEGSFQANDGPCVGTTSVDIGVAESSSTQVGFSLQKQGTGSQGSDFAWVAPIAETPGEVNTGQTFVSSTTCDPTGPTGPPIKTIDEIQGSGFESTLLDEDVTVENAIVTLIGRFNSPNGFFMQQADEDNDSATSTGIFVFTGSSPGVSVGDIVTVTGRVGQFSGLTQITGSPDITIVSSGNALPVPVSVTLPVADRLNLEALEGMLVSFSAADPANKKLVVSEYFNLDRFGAVSVCAADTAFGRPFQYTQFNEPDQAGFAEYQDELFRSCVTTDDNFGSQNPDPVDINGAYTVDKENLLRGGSEVTALTGIVIDPFGDGYYSFIPTVFEIDQTTNPRPETPPLLEDPYGKRIFRKKLVKFVITNVLNYFTSIDPFSCSSPFRGADGDGNDLADVTAEFDRQAQKTTTGLGQLDADIYGLVEIENFNYGAVLDLTARLNEATGKKYKVATVEAGISRAGTDAIRVDVLYDSRKLVLQDACVLSDDIVEELGLLPGNTEPIFDGEATNRSPVAVTLRTRFSRRSVTLVMNHFKSKGQSGAEAGTEEEPNPNFDQQDGAGFWNDRRTKASQAVLAWVEHEEFCGSSENVVIAGDLNAYAKEDPVQTIEAAGYVSVKDLSDPASYSFLFGGQFGTLDYAYVKGCFADKVGDAATWHVNADEPDLFDYNLDFGRNPELFDGTTPYRFSDHDPIVFTMELPQETESCSF